jgi:hypothetical protein
MSVYRGAVGGRDRLKNGLLGHGGSPGGGGGRERTEHLRYKTDQRHALQRRETLMVPQLWSYAR